MKLFNFLLLTTLVLVTFNTNILAQNKNKQDILASIGNSSKWNNTNYILFTSLSKTALLKERAFLIDKTTGQVRFDGTTIDNNIIVLLFNFKSKALDKAYINGKLSESTADIHYEDVLSQLFKDTKLLFLPMLVISSNKDKISIGQEKILNTQKLTEINFDNIYNIDNSILQGTIYINNKGEVKEYLINESTYTVSDIKDIGDGNLLPTKFVNINIPSLSTKFNIVASFMDIESNKFTDL